MNIVEREIGMISELQFSFSPMHGAIRNYWNGGYGHHGSHLSMRDSLGARSPQSTED